MTSFFRPHCVRYTFRPSTSQLCQRFSSTSPSPSSEEAEVATKRGAGVRSEAVVDTDTYEQWIQSEGLKWRDPDSSGPKWLGGNVVRSLHLD